MLISTCVSLRPIRVLRACPIFFMSMSLAGVLNPGVMSPGNSVFCSLGSTAICWPWFSTAFARNVSGTGVNLHKDNKTSLSLSFSSSCLFRKWLKQTDKLGPLLVVLYHYLLFASGISHLLVSCITNFGYGWPFLRRNFWEFPLLDEGERFLSDFIREPGSHPLWLCYAKASNRRLHCEVQYTWTTWTWIKIIQLLAWRKEHEPSNRRTVVEFLVFPVGIFRVLLEAVFLDVLCVFRPFVCRCFRRSDQLLHRLCHKDLSRKCCHHSQKTEETISCQLSSFHGGSDHLPLMTKTETFQRTSHRQNMCHDGNGLKTGKEWKLLTCLQSLVTNLSILLDQIKSKRLTSS